MQYKPSERCRPYLMGSREELVDLCLSCCDRLRIDRPKPDAGQFVFCGRLPIDTEWIHTCSPALSRRSKSSIFASSIPSL